MQTILPYSVTSCVLLNDTRDTCKLEPATASQHGQHGKRTRREGQRTDHLGHFDAREALFYVLASITRPPAPFWRPKAYFVSDCCYNVPSGAKLSPEGAFLQRGRTNPCPRTAASPPHRECPLSLNGGRFAQPPPADIKYAVASAGEDVGQYRLHGGVLLQLSLSQSSPPIRHLHGQREFAPERLYVSADGTHGHRIHIPILYL